MRAAVGAGVLKEGQAAALTALAHSRRGAREDLSAGDEPFELFRGFNEIFIMVGLCILGAGWIGLAFWVLYANPETWRLTLSTYMVVTVAMIWLMSEYFIRYRRMVGPAILLSIMFAATAAFGLSQWRAQVFMLAREDFSSLILPGLLTVVAVFIYWLRFKVPFAMALMALGLFGTALLLTATRNGSPRSISELFVLSGGGGFGLITLALGLATFAVAMIFDGSDPHRVTRRSAQGFWLHLVAAPMIINTVALTLLARESHAANLTILGLMALFAVIAVVIDRRSFLLAAIGYTVSVILTLNPITENQSFAGLILALGLFLVLLGAFWAPIRAALLRVIPLGRLRRFLPPAHPIG
nr:hypothetical protein [Frigidibacter sp. ROC022]